MKIKEGGGMDIEKEREAFEKECRLLCYKGNMVMSNLGSFYNNEQTNWMWQMWLSSKAKTVQEGFVEKTESNTHHYFKLKDWDEWTCIDGIKDAIASDHDINAIVEVECLEVTEINNKPCFALLAFGKHHGTEVRFFDTEEEAIEAQEPAND